MSFSSSNRHSALKVVKSAGRYAETARDEIKLLRQVMAANPSDPGRDHVVSFLDSFNHTPSAQNLAAFTDNQRSSSAAAADVHICIVFEPLGENLLALIERHKATGVPPALVKVITKQVLKGLQYLHDECELVHTDVKPENISKWLCVMDRLMSGAHLSFASCSVRNTRCGISYPGRADALPVADFSQGRRPTQASNALWCRDTQARRTVRTQQRPCALTVLVSAEAPREARGNFRQPTAC